MRFRRSPSSVVVLMLALLAAAPAGAAPRPSPALPNALSAVVLEVSSLVPVDAALEQVIRKAAAEALRDIDPKTLAVAKKPVLSVSIVKLDVTPMGAQSKVSCKVSAMLRDDAKGKLLATLEGRAGTMVDPTATTSAKSEIAAYAVRGAISGLPATLDRLR